MPAFVKTPEDERLWAKAKARAKEEGHAEDWAYVTGIFKKMKGGKVAAILMDPHQLPEVGATLEQVLLGDEMADLYFNDGTWVAVHLSWDRPWESKQNCSGGTDQPTVCSEAVPAAVGSPAWEIDIKRKAVRAALTQDQKDRVIELLKSKPIPIPDKPVHDLSDKMKIDTDELESYIYGLAQGALKGKIPGGLADNKPKSDFDPKAIAQGVKVELEHTDDKELAAEIARDHLTEDPKYYDKLERMESGMCDKKASRVAARYLAWLLV
jgi:hypothetical protein